jgi:hypothetical protein
MARRSAPTPSDQPENSTMKSDRNVSLDDIEETAISLWLLEQLNRIQKLLEEHGSDDEMLQAVEYLIEDNERWISPEIALHLGSTRTGEA